MKKSAISLLKFLAFFLGWAVIAGLIPLPAVKSPAVWRLWAEVVPLLAIIAFTLLFRRIDRQNVWPSLPKHPGRGLVIGAAAGMFWLAAPVLLQYASGTVRFESAQRIALMPVWMLAVFLNAAMQELLVRGYLYQMLKQRHSLPAAVAATTALFTLMHGGAFEAGVIPVCNVITMSLLMTAVLERTDSLTVPIIMHFLWNGIGALVLGVVSLADDYPRLLTAVFSGGELLTGGICRLEGSIVVLPVNVLLTALFMRPKREKMPGSGR